MFVLSEKIQILILDGLAEMVAPLHAVLKRMVNHAPIYADEGECLSSKEVMVENMAGPATTWALMDT